MNRNNSKFSLPLLWGLFVSLGDVDLLLTAKCLFGLGLSLLALCDLGLGLWGLCLCLGLWCLGPCLGLKCLGLWCLSPCLGLWCLGPCLGLWCLGLWCLVPCPGLWCLGPCLGLWCLGPFPGLWCLGPCPGLWCRGPGLWCLGPCLGLWCLPGLGDRCLGPGNLSWFLTGLFLFSKYSSVSVVSLISLSLPGILSFTMRWTMTTCLFFFSFLWRHGSLIAFEVSQISSSSSWLSAGPGILRLTNLHNIARRDLSTLPIAPLSFAIQQRMMGRVELPTFNCN